jgi:hypothetical protein
MQMTEEQMRKTKYFTRCIFALTCRLDEHEKTNKVLTRLSDCDSNKFYVSFPVIIELMLLFAGFNFSFFLFRSLSYRLFNLNEHQKPFRCSQLDTDNGQLDAKILYITLYLIIFNVYS